MRYYIIDSGQDMMHIANNVEAWMKSNEFHYILYLTDNPTFIGVEEVTEDVFLDHFKNTNQNG